MSVSLSDYLQLVISCIEKAEQEGDSRYAARILRECAITLIEKANEIREKLIE